MTAYYNELDPKAATWLRELIAAGLIAPGDVDERSVEDVRPDELLGYTQCHFFAGIGGWSLALRLAGWPDDKPVWTGSCPCQPFSAAGKGAGFDDERHLWPAFHWLIEQCRPPSVFGEQVASRDGLAWIDLVQADLEGTGYAFGAADLCAAGIGAPHIRQRLFWVGHRIGAGLERHAGDGDRATGRARAAGSVAEAGCAGGLADASGERVRAARCGADDGAPGQAESNGQEWQRVRVDAGDADTAQHARHGATGTLHGQWADADWLLCRDGKWRPVESGTFPLAHGIPARVVRLRGYGNAIVPQVAAMFIEASAP